MRSLCLLLFLSIQTSYAYSQEPLVRTVDLNGHYGGLRAHQVFTDSQGRIWMATNQGLFSFDGLGVYPCHTEAEMAEDKISALYEDPQQILWVGYQSGLIRYLENDTLKIWQIKEGLPDKAITGFISDNNGFFWFSTYGEGLYCHRDVELFNFNEDDGLLSDEVYCLDMSRQGHLLLGTDHGINICSWQGKEKIVQNYGLEDGLPDGIILSLAVGQNNEFWIGTHDKGFGKYDASQGTFYSADPQWQGGPITKLIYQDSSHIYVGTAGQGIYIYDPIQLRLAKLSGLSELKTISDFSIDQQFNHWVVGDRSEVKVIHDRIRFYPFDGQPIQALAPNQSTELWLGTAEGVFRMDFNRGTHPDKIHLTHADLNVISLDIDMQNNLWVGTFGQGLYRFDPKDQSVEVFKEASGLINDNILSIRCHKNKIWLATLGGASSIEYPAGLKNREHVIHNHIDDLGLNYIYHILIDRSEKIWFALDGRGVHCRTPNGSLHYQVDEAGDELNSVYSIAEDLSGKIWLINSDGKVFYQVGSKFRHLSTLPLGFALSGITCGSSGEIILTHDHGLILINPDNFSIAYLGEEYGLSQLHPNLNALAVGKDGHTWIGAKDEVIRFEPKKDEWYYQPSILLDEVSLFNQPVNTSKPLLFKPNENHLGFRYQGLSYFNPRAVTYRYQLVGYDPAWKKTQDRSVSYPRLPAGNFTFQVQASLTNSFDGYPIKSISFEIRKAIYDRPIFWVFTVLSGYLVFYWYAAKREQKLKLEADRQRKNIELQYYQLQSQINPHFLFNSYNTLLNIIDEQPEIAGSYVERLSDFYRQVLTLKETDLTSLEEEIQLVRDYYYLIKQRYGESIELVIELDSWTMCVPPLAVQMLVENAVKHNIISKKNPLIIRISESSHRIVVSNNLQPKLHPTRSTSFGLRNIKERYALLLNEPVVIDQSDDHFTVSLPLIRNKTVHANSHH